MPRRYSQVSGFLMCRTVGHSWDVIDATSSGKFGGNPIWLRCLRCNTERHDSFNANTGDLYTRQYVYQDSYRHAFDNNFGDAAPTRSDYRMMLLEQAIVRQRDKRMQEHNNNGKA
jgi:hypothetical protein